MDEIRKYIQNGRQLLEYLKNKKIIIYGAGQVGKSFLNVLERNGLDKNVLYFAQSEYEAGKKINEIEIRSIAQALQTEDTVICVAVHDCNKDSLIQQLEKLEIRNYVWIYPFLWNMAFGQPQELNVEIYIGKILKNMMQDYRSATRYLAIEQYYGFNQNGYDIYRQLMALHASKDTVEWRLQHFIDTIKNWKQEEKEAIALTKKGIVVDGSHRLTLECYHRQEKIRCNVYHTECQPVEYIGKAAILECEYVKEKIKDRNIIEQLDDANERILKSYGIEG